MPEMPVSDVTLAYEVTLARLGGRWEITRIQS